MRQFTISIAIAAPPDRVWRVMSDVERWHEWTPSIASIKRLDAGPFGVGSRALVRQPKFPPAVWRVETIDSGRQFTWASTAPGIRTIGRHVVEAAPGGSRVTLTVDFQGALGGVMAWMAGAITQRYITLEANGLKARSEDAAFWNREGVAIT